MCFSFRWRRKKDGARPSRIASFRQQQRRPFQTLNRFIPIATLVSPTENGFHKPPPAGKATSVAGASQGTADGGPTPTHEKPSPGPHAEIESGLHSKKQLILNETVERHFRHLYEDLCGGATTLSRDRFAAFIDTAQVEVVLPLDREELTFQQFLEVWYFQYGLDAVRPLRDDELDTTRPISNYFISSSHNTYLCGNQLTSSSSAQAYRRVLTRNCRCIEIDVHNGEAPPSRTTLSAYHGRHPSSASSPPSFLGDASKANDSSFESATMLSPSRPPTLGAGHARSVSSVEPTQLPSSARQSTQSLCPSVASEKLGRPRSSSKGSRQSSSKAEPVVMHGNTFTSPVGFREVCQAIRETAFQTSALPIIVSLEVHADPDQQEIMVEIMKEEWDGILLDRPLEDCAPHQRQPRLEELLNKILVKVKKSPANLTVPTGTNLAVVALPKDDELTGSEDERDTPGKKTRKVPICEALSALAVYTHSEHFRSLDLPAARVLTHIFSVSESRVLELYAQRPRDVLLHNRGFFMRVFPNGLRVDSSNPDPSLFWSKGVQMVAMNWQSWDEDMALNHAMFHGSPGWVLKPPGYRTGDPAPLQDAAFGRLRTLDLRVTFYAGQHVPLPEARYKDDDATGTAVGLGTGTKRFRPYVKVDLIVDRSDEKAGKNAASEPGTGEGAGSAEMGKGTTREGQYRRKTVPGETDSPDWGRDGCCLAFSGVRLGMEELSFVRFKVEDDSSYFRGSSAAWACVRLDRLRQGYRFIELLDAKGKPTPGTLFVKITKTLR
ncbi:hypothetical protein VTK73DRAFT_2726 [Phialemonium thermophilum]|uniref:Phosphoinositide phospholipase C n=1 Tax=Phialemonium thermophilum TaxID=223376 RepID=A0ABR3X3K3_9PEZI